MSPQQHYKRRSKEAGGIKGLIRLTDSPDQPIDRPLWHTVTIAIIWAPLRSREDGCQRSSHYLSAIYRSERERDGERDTDTKTWDAIFEVHLQSTDFSSAQSLWAISTCNNPPPLLLLLCLSGRPDIKPRDLSVYLSICLWLNYAGPSLVRMFLYNNTKKHGTELNRNVLHLNIIHSFKRWEEHWKRKLRVRLLITHV